MVEERSINPENMNWSKTQDDRGTINDFETKHWSRHQSDLGTEHWLSKYGQCLNICKIANIECYTPNITPLPLMGSIGHFELQTSSNKVPAIMNRGIEIIKFPQYQFAYWAFKDKATRSCHTTQRNRLYTLCLWFHTYHIAIAACLRVHFVGNHITFSWSRNDHFEYFVCQGLDVVTLPKFH